LVIEAIQITESGCRFAPPSKITPLSVAAAAATPGTAPESTAA
jgi:hypothetical protein